MSAPTTTKAPTLYALGQEFDALDALLEEQQAGTQADLETVTKWLEELDGALNDKLRRCIAWAAVEEALADAAAGEVKRLEALAKRRRERVKRVKRAVLELFKAQELTRVDTPLGPVRRVKNGGQAPVVVADGVDLFELPAGCYRAVIEPVKDELRKRLKAGEQIEGVTLGDVGERIEFG